MLNTDLQKLEPGNRVRLVEVDGTKFGADILRFHSDTLPIRRKNWPLLAGTKRNYQQNLYGGRARSTGRGRFPLRGWKYPPTAKARSRN